MQGLPTGTVTFLFTDIEGSTRLLQQLGDSYADVLDHHRTIVRDVLSRLGGQEFGTEGDAFFLVFSSASAAVAAAAEIQRSLAKSPAAGGTPVRIRMGVHTGEGRLRDGDYVGIDLHRVARIAAAGHGGQVLLSESTAALVRGQLPEGTAVRDLGSYGLKDLKEPEHLYQLDIEGLRSDFPSIRSAGAEAGNLPRQLTSFVGRQRELERCRELLGETRLLTLTGPGGTGKTRLALQIADTTRGEFSAGAWFVALGSIRDPELVPSTIAETLGLMETQGSRPPLELVIDHLQNKDALLVLDNFEQIVPAGPIVTDLLNATTGVKVVVTSRAPLRLYGEHEFPVPPLGLPDPRHLPDLATLSHYEAVALFIDRARGVKPDFAVTNENAPAVAEICARLDGLPLAIELAAARIRIFPPQTMLARLGDRLALLTGGSRDLPGRQQTLRQAVAWSHDLLSEPEQRLFARFAVFRGGAHFDDAEAVCGPADALGMDVLEALDSLVEKSLLTVTDEGEGGPRFGMLETIREFAQEQLDQSGDADEVAGRHANVFLELAEEAERQVLGKEGGQWLDRLELDHDNIRAALDWACEGQHTEAALRMTGALWRFWQIRGHLPEAAMRVDRALSLPATPEDSPARLKALEAAGGIAYWRSELERTEAFYQQALQLAEEMGDKAATANALYNLSFPSAQRGEGETARSLMERSVSLFKELGDAAGLSRAHWGLGNADFLDGNYAAAKEHFEMSLAKAREAGDEFQAGWALYMLGSNAIRDGSHPDANAFTSEALRMFSSVGDFSGIVFCLESMAELAEEAERQVLGKEGGQWLDRLELDHDNIRAALDW
ncbi:MAG TPA: adenylate/guanylate cyclase domain-containing protein, partial [Actinomycetota bacterium]|nr:adenylate/guanylate cyclase domain-containing protein [Actinomycetota bacterium]